MIVRKAALAAAVLGLGFLAGTSQASTIKSMVINFDPDGAAGPAPVSQVKSFEMAPGNALAQNAIAAANEAYTDALLNQESPIGKHFEFTQYYQARVSSLLDKNGLTITDTGGLNSTYQLTVIAAFNSVGTILSKDHFTYRAAGGPDFIRIYYNDAVTSDNLTGAGFNDGSLVLDGDVIIGDGSFDFTNVNGVRSPIEPFDGYSDAAPWTDPTDPSKTWYSYLGTGSVDITGKVKSIDTGFFTDGLAKIRIALANTTTGIPFEQTDPSQQFVSLDGVNLFTPDLGNTFVNGDGPDVQLQATGPASFSVPTPEACIAGLGLLGLIIGSRAIRNRREA